MSTSTPKIPAGQEGLIPHLVCSPCTEAIVFYKKAFGAEEVSRLPAPDGKRIMHAQIRIGKSFIFLVDDFPEFCGGKSSTATALKGTPVSIHHYVEDCDALFNRAVAAGGQVPPGPMGQMQDQFWGDRSGTLTDPHGYTWTNATRKEELTPEEMKQRQDEWMKSFASQPSHA